nr:uncharacterized protein LOC127335422 [Lolium perenne]
MGDRFLLQKRDPAPIPKVLRSRRTVPWRRDQPEAPHLPSPRMRHVRCTYVLHDRLRCGVGGCWSRHGVFWGQIQHGGASVQREEQGARCTVWLIRSVAEQQRFGNGEGAADHSVGNEELRNVCPITGRRVSPVWQPGRPAAPAGHKDGEVAFCGCLLLQVRCTVGLFGCRTAWENIIRRSRTCVAGTIKTTFWLSLLMYACVWLKNIEENTYFMQFLLQIYGVLFRRAYCPVFPHI